MGFKEDVDFARFLTMGAYGAVALKRDLEGRGHQIIELERYAMGNKVWSVKVKRLRIPDLLCVRCGRRFESKAKSKLEIKLSHSATSGREWHAGGMREDDVFGFIRVVLAEGGPRTGSPIYVTRAALHEAMDSVKAGTRKAVSEGAEADISWPIWVPSYSGYLPLIVPLDDEGNIYVHKSSGGKGVYRTKNWSQSYLYLAPGDSFEGGFTAVAGCVAPADVDCKADRWDWRADLSSARSDDRYAAVKSCYARTQYDLVKYLNGIVTSEDEDWRIRLEAIGVLASTDASSWVPSLRAVATDVTVPLEQQMEAVLLLSELDSAEASDALYSAATAEMGMHEEVRSAAVWGLGVGSARRPDRVVEFLADESDRVALHAASALSGVLSPQVTESLKKWLIAGEERKAAVAASVLARNGRIQALLDVVEATDGLGSLLALRALGDLPRAQVERSAGSGVNRETLRLLEPIWVQHRDWLRNPENAGALDILDAQQVRFS